MINNDIFRIKLQKNGKVLCAKARYSNYGKLYTFLVDKIVEVLKWYVEDTFQEVTVEEFLELSVRDFPVPSSRMKYIYPIETNATKPKNTYSYTMNSEDSIEDYIDTIKFLLSQEFKIIDVNDDYSRGLMSATLLKNDLLITIYIHEDVGVGLISEEDIIELVYEIKKNLKSKDII